MLPEAFLNLCALLIRVPAVVGAEHAFFRALARELEERGARVTSYEGLLVAQGSDPDRIMFSALGDRHGLICTGPGELQYAAFVAGTRSDLLRNRDANARFNDQMTARVPEACAAHGHSTLFKDDYVEAQNARLVKEGGTPGSIRSTELGRIIAASEGLVDGTTLQVPTTGYHTMEETAPIASVSSSLDVLATLAGVAYEASNSG